METQSILLRFPPTLPLESSSNNGPNFKIYLDLPVSSIQSVLKYPHLHLETLSSREDDKEEEAVSE